MPKRNVLNSPRLLELKKHRRRVLEKKIMFSMFLFLSIFSAFIYVSHLPILNISSIEIQGNKVINTELIKENIQDEIFGKYLYIFPKSNLFFYPKVTIKNNLQNKFQRIKDINLSINKKVLQVSIIEREALYTWCGDVLPVVDDATEYKCYFMDEDGYLFDEAPYFSGNVYFRFFGNIEIKENILGSSFVPNRFSSLVFFKKSLESMDLKPSAFFVNNMGELNVFFSTRSSLLDGPVFMLKMDADFNKILENLDASLSTEPLKSKFTNNYSSLEYIDLRFGNKVYFKFK